MIEEKSFSLDKAIKLVTTNFMMQINEMDVAYPYFQGAPGGGKTASLQALGNGLEFMGKKYETSVISTHFALKPPEETGGIPQFENIQIDGQNILATIWSFPDIMKELYKLSDKYKDKDGLVIWLLDDMHLCGPVHLAMLYELLTERKLREFKVPKNVAICLAGNTSNKAGAKTMFSAIVNRVFLCPVHTEFENWKNNFAIPNKFHIGVRSFLENDMYQQFFHEDEQVDSAWGSPRSWTRFASMIQIMEQMNDGKTLNSDEILYICTGHVGKSAASDFVSFYKIFNRFDLDHILNNIDDYTLPDSSVDRYALAFAGVNYYINNHKDKNIIENFAKMVIKYGEESPELSIMIMKEIINNEKLLNMKTLYTKVALKIEEFNETIFNEILNEIVDL